MQLRTGFGVGAALCATGCAVEREEPCQGGGRGAAAAAAFMSGEELHGQPAHGPEKPLQPPLRAHNFCPIPTPAPPAPPMASLFTSSSQTLIFKRCRSQPTVVNFTIPEEQSPRFGPPHLEIMGGGFV